MPQPNRSDRLARDMYTIGQRPPSYGDRVEDELATHLLALNKSDGISWRRATTGENRFRARDYVMTTASELAMAYQLTTTFETEWELIQEKITGIRRNIEPKTGTHYRHPHVHGYVLVQVRAPEDIKQNLSNTIKLLNKTHSWLRQVATWITVDVEEGIKRVKQIAENTHHQFPQCEDLGDDTQRITVFRPNARTLTHEYTRTKEGTIHLAIRVTYFLENGLLKAFNDRLFATREIVSQQLSNEARPNKRPDPKEKSVRRWIQEEINAYFYWDDQD